MIIGRVPWLRTLGWHEEEYPEQLFQRKMDSLGSTYSEIQILAVPKTSMSVLCHELFKQLVRKKVKHSGVNGCPNT